jgi:hypothetical protein
MASARIRLDVDPVSKKRTIVISYESDSDALPQEHEEAHRALLDKLFEKGLAKPGDGIRVEREGQEAPAGRETNEQAEREGVKQGS